MLTQGRSAIRALSNSITRCATPAINYAPYIVAALCVVSWFWQGKVIYFTDSTFSFDPPRQFYQSFWAWDPTLNFGTTNLTIAFMPYYLALAALSAFLPLSTAQALIWFAVVASSGVGMDLFLREVLPSHAKALLPRVVASLFFELSPYWIFVGLQDPFTGVIVYAMTPYFLTLVVRFSKTKSWTVSRFLSYYLVSIALIFVALPGLLSQYGVVMPVVLVGFFASILLLSRNRTTLKSKLKAGAGLVLAIAGTFALWELPVIGLHGNVSSSLSASSPLGSTLYTWLVGNSPPPVYALLNVPPYLLSPTRAYFAWTWMSWYSAFPAFPLLYLIPILMAWASLLFTRNRRNSIVSISALFLCILSYLSLGVSPPTGSVYHLAFEFVPGFVTLDNPYVWFSPFTYFFETVLLFAFLSSIWPSIVRPVDGFRTQVVSPLQSDRKRLRVHGARSLEPSCPQLVGAVSLASILVITGVLAVPLIDGQGVPQGTPSARVVVPGYLDRISSLINSKPSDSRVLAYPLYVTDSQANWPGGGYYALNPLSQLVSDPVVSTTYGLPLSEQAALTDLSFAIYSGNTTYVGQMLSSLSIRFVVLQGDASTDPGSWVAPFDFGGSESVLNRTSNVTYEGTFGPEAVFEDLNAPPLISGVEGVYSQPTVVSPLGVNPPLVFPATLSNVYGAVPLNVTSWAFTEFGNQYSNVIPRGVDSFEAYFNLSTNHTWPYLQIETNDSLNLIPARTPYLIIEHSVSTGCSLRFQLNLSADSVLTEEAAAVSPTGVTDALSFPAASRVMSLLIFVIPGPGYSSCIVSVNDISAAVSIGTTGSNLQFVNFGPMYSSLSVNGTDSFRLRFNMTESRTWSFEVVQTLTPLNLDPTSTPYLQLRYQSNQQVTLSYLLINGFGVSARPSLISSVQRGGWTTVTLGLNVLAPPVESLQIIVTPGASGLVLTVSSISPVTAISSSDYVPLLARLGISATTSVLSSVRNPFSASEAIYSISKVSSDTPTSWTGRLEVRQTGYILLLFRMSYSPAWSLSVSGLHGSPVQTELDGMFDGWWVLLTSGNYTFGIGDTQQQFFAYGAAVTVLSLGGTCFICLFRPWTRLRRRRTSLDLPVSSDDSFRGPA